MGLGNGQKAPAALVKSWIIQQAVSAQPDAKIVRSCISLNRLLTPKVRLEIVTFKKNLNYAL